MDVFPKDLNVVITNDQSKFTKNMVNNLENSIIMGVLLVVGVLIFFLGLRNSMFVGIAIPLSMLMGIAILNFSGTTLNMMVLFSLILALGMLVDNGIVIVENIYRLYSEKGKSKEKASKEGTGEVATAIIASTATTVAAFLPLMFWKSLMGEFFKYLPLTLIIVLSSSLFVALVINPVLTADWIKVGNSERKERKKVWIRMFIVLALGILFYLISSPLIGGLFILGFVLSVTNRYFLRPGGEYFMANVMPKLESSYSNFLTYALKGKRPLKLMCPSYLIPLAFGSALHIAFKVGVQKNPVIFTEKNECARTNAQHLLSGAVELLHCYLERRQHAFIYKFGI